MSWRIQTYIKGLRQNALSRFSRRGRFGLLYVLHELGRVGFRQVNGLALDVFREARKHRQNGFWPTFWHHAISSIHAFTAFKRLGVAFLVTDVEFLGHLVGNFSCRMSV